MLELSTARKLCKDRLQVAMDRQLFERANIEDLAKWERDNPTPKQGGGSGCDT